MTSSDPLGIQLAGRLSLDLSHAMYLFAVQHALAVGVPVSDIIADLRTLADDVAVALVGAK